MAPIFPASPATFLVTQERKALRITWDVPEARGDLATFLYWAAAHGARYRTRLHAPAGSRRRRGQGPCIELYAASGIQGEYREGLLFDLTTGIVYREEPSTRLLVHHGLDGWPAACVLPRNVSIFTVKSRAGAFALTLDEWYACLASWRVLNTLGDLGVEIKVQPAPLPLQGEPALGPVHSVQKELV